MATLSDLREVKEALDAGLVSQAEFDEVKRDYLRGMEECQKLELQAKKEALEANKEFEKRKSEADLRAYALESIVKHGSSIMSEDQKADLVRDYVKMSGLDRLPADSAGAPGAEPASKGRNYRCSKCGQHKKGHICPFAKTGPNEDDSDSDEPMTGKRCQKKWTEEDDAALVAALRAGQRLSTIKIRGRSGQAAQDHLRHARENGSGSPALREYLEETCPEYVYRGPPKGTFGEPWSAEEDQTFIQAHREGKTHGEIAAMLPGRSHSAVGNRWREVKIGKTGTAALKAYVAEYCKAAASQSQVPSVPRPRTGPPPLDDSCQTTRVDQSRPVLLRLDVLEGAPEAVECRLDALPVQSVHDEQRPDDE